MRDLPREWFEDHDGQALVLSTEKVRLLYDYAKTVLETFEKDEARGYRSRDRQFAIDLLRKALGQS